jgi:iron(III) transport system ATP-binding protein
VTRLATEKRNAVMCFQSYALWPHMSVRDNVGFGLETRNWPGPERETRIDEVLKLVQLEALGKRKPNELSGGQQQRVALARALAVNPACLLLDEPLSNLDAKLRHEMRGEIRRICKSAQFTTIYVTHDQREALSVADRIALLKDGHIVQVGTPQDLYHRPASSFVAGFVGQTNLIAGRIVERIGGEARVETAVGTLTASISGDVPDKVIVSIRPERLRAARAGDAAQAGVSRFDAKLIETTFLGESSEHLLESAGQRLQMICAPPMFQPPEQITLEVDARDVVLLRD